MNHDTICTLSNVYNEVLKYNYWCPLKVNSIIPMCPQCYCISIVDTFSRSKPFNQKALVPVVMIYYFQELLSSLSLVPQRMYNS